MRISHIWQRGVILACLAGISIPGSARGENWPRFRGPNGSGISSLRGLPVKWGLTDYEWVVELSGAGHSSPVIWKDTLFVTTVRDDGVRLLICLDAITGKQKWAREKPLGTSGQHRKNSYASSTPTTDGKRVYVEYSDAEHYWVLAYDLDGKELWSHDCGPYLSQHGQGSSPIVFNDLVFVTNDQEKEGISSLTALEAATGEVAWKIPRKTREAAYSTPFMLELPGQSPQLVTMSGANGISGIDPATGREIWTTGQLPERAVMSPVFGNGIIMATSGSGGRGKYLVALEPEGASGIVGADRIRFERKENIPYVPTPIIWEGNAYLWNDDGIVNCVNLADGKDVWRKRIGGNYSASPILIDGKLYAIDEEGNVHVMDASKEYNYYGSSPLGDQSHATPAVANGRLYLRGFKKLASLKSKG